MDVQYMAYWLNGNGTQNLMEPDLPLLDVKVTREMNGLGRLTASLPPEWGKTTAFSGRPVIQEWATAIYVEIAGDCFDGFLVVETEDDNDKLTIDAVGFIGYAEGQPWPERGNGFNGRDVRVDLVIQQIWQKVQYFTTSNLGLDVSTPGGSAWPRVGNPVWDEVPVPKDPGKSNAVNPGNQPKAPSYPSYPTSGTTAQKKKEYERRKKQYAADRKAYEAALKTWKAKKAAFDKAKKAYEDKIRQYKQDADTRKRMIEDAKFKMNYWSTHDLLSTFQQLAQETGFSYRVDHTRSGNEHTHVLRCAPGRLGVRRPQFRFIEGENVYSIPKVTHQGDEKVTSAVVLGNGEGSKMKWLQKSRSAGGSHGLRRARVFADKTLTRTAQLDARAKEVLNAYNDPIDIEEFVVIDHGLAPIRTFDVGDEIELQTLSRRAGNFKRWVTIQSITLSPEQNQMSVKVVPVEQE